MTRISHIELNDAGLPPPTPEIEQERKVAMFDLLEENSFSLPPRGDRVAPDGPYHLGLAIRDKRLVFDVQTEAQEPAAEFHLSLGPLRQVVKDYFQQKQTFHLKTKINLLKNVHLWYQYLNTKFDLFSHYKYQFWLFHFSVQPLDI